MEARTNRVTFNKSDDCEFLSILRLRVNHLLKEHKISPKANFSMCAKSVVLMSVVLAIYLAIFTGIGDAFAVFGLYALLGFSVAIGAMNIAHDALHGAYTSHSKKNRILGLLMDLFGASSFYWKKEHTIDHHTFTNIAEHDADLDVPFILRLCPKAPRLFFHRIQHWYAPFLYCFNLIRWVYYSDTKRILRILKDRSTAPGNPSRLEATFMVTFKILHIFLFLLLPIITLPLAWWQVALGYVGFLGATSLTMTTIFQLAHIVENVTFPLPDEQGKIENSFAKHQLATTSNFAMRSRIVSFLFGGLNFQVEHHLFPHICHIHLRKISPIVQSTAKEFGLKYHNNPSFFAALKSHFKTLKKLGRYT